MVSGFYMIIPDIWDLIGSICHVSSFIPISFLSHSYDFHSHYPHKWFWVITHMFHVWNMNPNRCPKNQPLGAHELPKTWDQNHRCHDVSRYPPREITHLWVDMHLTHIKPCQKEGHFFCITKTGNLRVCSVASIGESTTNRIKFMVNIIHLEPHWVIQWWFPH